MHRRTILLHVLAALLLVNGPWVRADDLECHTETATAAGAADGRRFDPADGRDARQYPPDPQVDYQHLKLDLRMPDPTTRSFTCIETLSFRTLGLPIERLALDAVNLDIKSVTDSTGEPLPHHYDDRRLTITFPQPLPAGSEHALVIEYACAKPTDGMTFALPDDGYPDRPLMVHTQGQTETNRHWFVAHDYPNERFTTEIVATVPSKLSVLANGALVEKTSAGDGLTRWHYRLGRPHVSYLVSLVIGEFEVVTETWRDIPVEYWVPPGQQDRAMLTFHTTPKMLDFFSRISGVDYPYEKYAQSVVYLFQAGGMENTSTTTLHEMSVLDERAALDQDLEGLISHELAHQWYGDMITCRSWAHIWLNEGFATYLSHLWDEHARGRDEYEEGIWHTMRDVAAASAPDPSGGMVWFYYDHSWETFRRRGNNAYSKGASVLHMLRQSLGDELFFKCLAEYTRRNAWKQAETDDLRKVIEELSGRSYERFFQQWIYRSGAPTVEATSAWDPQTRVAKVTLAQTQEIGEHMPAFTTPVDVWLVDASGNVAKHVVDVDGRSTVAHLPSDAEPVQVVIDPRSAVLMTLELKLPLGMLVEQAKAGPTTIARFSAIAALAKRDRDAARDALREIVADESAWWGLRAEAAAALGAMQTDAARDILLDSLNGGIEHHKLRRAVVRAIGGYRDRRVAEALVRLARSDPSYAVEAEASEQLGKQDPDEEVIAVLLANASKPSYRDQIRASAVEALSHLGDERGIDPAKALAAYGQPFRTRPTGIESLGRLGRELGGEQRDEIRAFLVSLMHDPQDRSAGSAIRALGEMGDEKAIPELEKFASSAAAEDLRSRARDAVKTIRDGGGGESSTVRSLRERVEQLEERDRSRRDGELEAKPAPATAPATAPADAAG